MIAIMKKELKNYFFSPIGYVVIAIFLFMFSAVFYDSAIRAGSTDLTSIFLFVAAYGGLMFMIPLLTMWSIAGERKSGTDQLIMTSPVSMLGVVMAKFISAVIFIIIPLIFTLMYFGILCHYQIPDIPTYLTSVLGFLLLSMTYIAFGILASSITESPIIAGILTIAFIFAVTWLPEMVSTLSNLSLMNPFFNFLEGKIDIAVTIMFITLTILFIMITMIILQRRKSVK